MKPTTDLGWELTAALEAAERAGAFIRGEYHSFAAIADAPASITTHVDKASQELILNHLHTRFPKDALCAEEKTAALENVPHSGPRVWVVDPIDGTRGFARKTGQFSTMIGLLIDNQPVLGVVMEPALDRYTYAWLGGGCWTRVGDGTSVRCTVSTRATLAGCVLTQSWSKPGQPTKPVQALSPKGVIETYSGGVKLAIVARGEADIYANTYEKFFDWDICAGHVLVTEAGGQVTDLAGNPIAYQAADFGQTRGLLATNGRIHAETKAALERAV
ncbi:MAG TPA: inositol monophosphatase family protein [Urbifossiella sp.]|nr:inositol monophosphatase family protein [Urbifossiella sp.]